MLRIVALKHRQNIATGTEANQKYDSSVAPLNPIRIQRLSTFGSRRCGATVHQLCFHMPFIWRRSNGFERNGARHLYLVQEQKARRQSTCAVRAGAHRGVTNRGAQITSPDHRQNIARTLPMIQGPGAVAPRPVSSCMEASQRVCVKCTHIFLAYIVFASRSDPRF